MPQEKCKMFYRIEIIIIFKFILFFFQFKLWLKTFLLLRAIDFLSNKMWRKKQQKDGQGTVCCARMYLFKFSHFKIPINPAFKCLLCFQRFIFFSILRKQGISFFKRIPQSIKRRNLKEARNKWTTGAKKKHEERMWVVYCKCWM